MPESPMAPLFNAGEAKKFEEKLVDISKAIGTIGTSFDAMSRKTLASITALSSKLDALTAKAKATSDALGGVGGSQMGGGGKGMFSNVLSRNGTTAGSAPGSGAASGSQSRLSDYWNSAGWGIPATSFGGFGGGSMTNLPNGGNPSGGASMSFGRAAVGAAAVATGAVARALPAAVARGTNWNQLEFNLQSSMGGGLDAAGKYARQFTGWGGDIGDLSQGLRTLNGVGGFTAGTTGFTSNASQAGAMASMSGGTMSFNDAATAQQFLHSGAAPYALNKAGVGYLAKRGQANPFNVSEGISQGVGRQMVMTGRMSAAQYAKQGSMLSAQQVAAQMQPGGGLYITMAASGMGPEEIATMGQYLERQAQTGGFQGGKNSLGSNSLTPKQSAAEMKKLNFSSTLMAKQAAAGEQQARSTQTLDVGAATSTTDFKLAVESFKNSVLNFTGITGTLGKVLGGAGGIWGKVGHFLPLAEGGPAEAGGTFLVGERGPEILKMGAIGGTVVPRPTMREMSATASLGGSGIEKLGKRMWGWNSGAASPTASTPASAPATTPTTSGSSGASGAQVVVDATKFLGVPYHWGGSTPRGFDCSGLTQYVYKEVGISLPHFTGDQVKMGQAVNGVQNAQPGDLVFFGGNGYDGSPSSPGHVGIYVGGGKQIDAPYPGQVVRYDNVGNPVAIRRYVNGNGAATTTSTTGSPSSPSGVSPMVSSGGGMGTATLGEGSQGSESATLAGALLPTFATAPVAPSATSASTSTPGGGGAGGGGSSPMPSDTSRKANALLGQQMAGPYGWGTGPEWEALNKVVMGESGWNTTAQNPTSPAYGIPQSLPGSKMASAGPDWATNPATQIKWMLKYIKDRYTDPLGAEAHEKAYGWYEGGQQFIDRDQMAMVHKGEMVVRAGAASAMRMNQLSGGSSKAQVTVHFDKGAITLGSASGGASTSAAAGVSDHDLDTLVSAIHARLEKKLAQIKVASE